MAALALLGGCAEIREARQAQDPASRRPGERTVTAAEAGLAADAPLTLERGLGVALASHPGPAIARARVEQAEAALRGIEAGYLPEIIVRGDFHAQKTGPGSPERRIVRTRGADVQARQLIHDFGRLDAAARGAVDRLAAAQSELRAAENDVAFEFRRAFFTVLGQEETLRVAEETVKRFERRLEQVRGFVEFGTRQKYDLTKAEADLGAARLNLVKAGTALAADRAALASAMGLAERVAWTLEKPPAAAGWPRTADETFEAALSGNPGYRALVLREEAAAAGVDEAVADYWPRLSADAALDGSAGLGATAWRAVVGALADWTVYSGGAKAAGLRSAVAGLREARAIRALEEQRIFADIRRAFAAYEDARESRGLADLTVRSAAETLDLVEGRYAAGRASAVEVTDAQAALADARGRAIRARYDFEIAIAALERAEGGSPQK